MVEKCLHEEQVMKHTTGTFLREMTEEQEKNV